MHLPAASAALLALAGTTVWASPVTVVSTRSLAVNPPAGPLVEERTLGLLGSLFCRRTFGWGCTPAPKPDPHGCKSSEFWWDKKSQCCTTGGNPSPPSCPSHASCPNGWYWSSDGYVTTRIFACQFAQLELTFLLTPDTASRRRPATALTTRPPVPRAVTSGSLTSSTAPLLPTRERPFASLSLDGLTPSDGPHSSAPALLPPASARLSRSSGSPSARRSRSAS